MRDEQREFAEFYQASSDSCLRAVTAVVGDHQLAEELVAEAFARAWTSWAKVGRHAAPRAWVVRTALNTGVSRDGAPVPRRRGAAPGYPARAHGRERERGHPMNEQQDVMSQVRESFSGLCMDVPLEQVFARSRARRRRRLSALTAAAAATAGAAVAVALAATAPAQSGPAPAGSGNPLPARTGPVRLAAFSVTNGPGGSTSGQPAVHIIPSGTPVRAGQAKR